MKAIKYIGKKARRSDSMADTGLTWAQGQVHVVTDQAAERLLPHKDIFVEVPIEEAMGGAKSTPDVTDSKKKPRATVEDDFQPVPNLSNMNLIELRQFARKQGIALPARITERTARTKVADAMKLKHLTARN